MRCPSRIARGIGVMRFSPFSLNFLRNAGIAPGDTEELRLQKTLLVFASGLFCLTSALWLAIYWSLNLRVSMTVPFIFQVLILANLIVYLKTGKFGSFRFSQLVLFLLAPFISQWSMGNFLTASGISLWGLLAPVGALLCIGPKESRFWFLAYIALTLLSGVFDHSFVGMQFLTVLEVPVRVSILFFVLNFTAVSTIVYLLLRYATVEKQKARARLWEAHLLLQEEQARAEKLLADVLPAQISERLKYGKKTVVDHFPDVSVMFVDVVDFTALADALPPSEIFSLLNRLFSSFDELVEKYEVEKIKTIGDAYMVASGLTHGRDHHVEAIAALALEIRELLNRDGGIGGIRLQVRIGIATGAVAAGVIGSKKYVYDLWGDTVNVASRIANDAAPGTILVDAATHHCLQRSFLFSKMQIMHLKGKGDMMVFLLEKAMVPESGAESGVESGVESGLAAT